ncbi:MAG: hypothetical protein LUC22_03955 [Prevotella sp.]|nr:hypothetical protein [Prevotella sp.]
MDEELEFTEQPQDDGGLAFLNIPRNKENKSYTCKQASQTDLLNTTFWVLDFTLVKTRFSKDGDAPRALMLVKKADGELVKVFTGSQDIIYILQEIEKRDAFPRRVTLKGNGTRFWFI